MSAQSAQLQTRLIDFGVAASRCAGRLRRGVAEANIAAQLVRAAMSPAANYAEACHAESRRDFVHKMQVCLKELAEANVWLSIAIKLGYRDPELVRVAKECGELAAIVAASVKTAKSRL
jgi:four helix bundle protein